MTDFRFVLESYQGPGSRFTCPQCKRKKKFTRYIDKETGKRLPDQYGRCDREGNCGYHFNPYQDGYSKEVYRTERRKNFPTQSQPPQSPVIHSNNDKDTFIPFEVMKASLGKYESNSFAQYLQGVFGPSKTADLIKRFYIGTSRYWPGASVFWIIDSHGRIPGGQIALFREDGHTAKDANGKRQTSWVHTALKASYIQQGLDLPDWLKVYLEGSNRFPCLYGLPQLTGASTNKPIAIVEAPKTAIICSGFFPQFIWLAVGGLSYLTEERLQDIAGRKGILFPDRGGFEKWSEKKTKIKALGSFGVSDMLERLDAEEGNDLADYLKFFVEVSADSEAPNLSPIASPLQRMKEANPVLKSLVEVFGLVSI